MVQGCILSVLKFTEKLVHVHEWVFVEFFCFSSILVWYKFFVWKLLHIYTNADLEISLYASVHTKTIPSKFRILNLRILKLK